MKFFCILKLFIKVEKNFFVFKKWWEFFENEEEKEIFGKMEKEENEEWEKKIGKKQ